MASQREQVPPLNKSLAFSGFLATGSPPRIAPDSLFPAIMPAQSNQRPYLTRRCRVETRLIDENDTHPHDHYKHKHNLTLARPPTFHAPPRARSKIYLSIYPPTSYLLFIHACRRAVIRNRCAESDAALVAGGGGANAVSRFWNRVVGR